MKLVRYGAAGREKPGVIDAAGRIRDLSGMVPDIPATCCRQGASPSSPR